MNEKKGFLSKENLFLNSLQFFKQSHCPMEVKNTSISLILAKINYHL